MDQKWSIPVVKGLSKNLDVGPDVPTFDGGASPSLPNGDGGENSAQRKRSCLRAQLGKGINRVPQFLLSLGNA